MQSNTVQTLPRCTHCGGTGVEPFDNHIEQSNSANVYEELKRTRLKCYRLKEEIKLMHAAFDEGEAAALRAEATAYKKALAAILHRLDEGEEITAHQLRRVVLGGLNWKTVRPRRRRLIAMHTKPFQAGG